MSVCDGILYFYICFEVYLDFPFERFRMFSLSREMGFRRCDLGFREMGLIMSMCWALNTLEQEPLVL
jgi:hypothetical protein